MTPLLEFRASVDYPGKPGVLSNVELSLARGEILALVGQSGSGKSTLALSVLGLLDSRGGRLRGEVTFDGAALNGLREKHWRTIRGRRIGLVLQSALSSLSPWLTVGAHFLEAWRAHAGSPGAGGGAASWKERALELLGDVSLPTEEKFLDRYPRELSVGLAQRVLIALGVFHRPELLIADEPTSALDVITQAEILDLFRRLNKRHGMAILLITHDLLSVASLAHRVAILRRGELVESGEVASVFGSPAHEYTQRLVAALPRLPGQGLIHLTEQVGTTEPLLPPAVATDEGISGRRA